MIYLASPYSSDDASLRKARFELACRAAAVWMGQGEFIFSPIAHTHPIAEVGRLPLGWDYWEKYDREMLSACSEVRVLMLAGWDESKGVAAEIAIATTLGLPVRYVEMPRVAGYE